MRLKLFSRISLILLSAAMLMASCQKMRKSEVHDTVVIKTELQAKTPATVKEGGVDQITIYATCDWTLECDDWFTVEPASGTQGVSESTITTQPNNTGAPRIGTIRLKAGSYSGTYTFTQAAE